MPVRRVFLQAFLAAALLCATNARSADPLAGLWKAKRRFGPDTRGTLVIEKRGDGYTADLDGWPVPVTVLRDELALVAPDGEGQFRGKLQSDGRITGYWARVGTPVDNGAYATPVRLARDGAGRWSGLIEPLQDQFTFYLLLEERPDGTFSAVLRNVERDIGSQYRVDHLVRNGSALRLAGRRGDVAIDVATGTWDADAAGLRLIFASRGGSYDFVRDTDASAFYPRGRQPVAYQYRKPQALKDGWAVGTLAEANIDGPAIRKLIQDIVEASMGSADAPQLHALLIARHGKLVLEEYFHGTTRETLHDTRSAGKSVTAVTVGAAMNAGAPLALASRVYEVMKDEAASPEADTRKGSMTLEDLLTMSSGFFCDDTNDAAPGAEETMTNQTDEPDYYRYTLGVPLVTAPGENSVYCSASAHLALGMAGRAAGESPMYLFERSVAAPMNITRYAWPLDPLGRPYGGGGVRLTARDFAKFGQLLLDGGSWRGRRVVSSAFAERASAKLYHLRNIYYGYLWWGEDYPYKSGRVYAYSARGAGGQTVTVVPQLALVVTTMAGNYFSRRGMMAASTDPIPRLILPAVREEGDDTGAPVISRDYTSPYGASKDGSRVATRHR